MQPIASPHPCIMLDASCIISLYASKRMDNILESLVKDVAVATYVYETEALRIFSGPEGDEQQATETINLQPFIARGLLRVVATETEDENNTYVNFACSLDDGEAITGAIAWHRNWAIATDDNKAIKLFTRDAPQMQRLSTLHLIKHWFDTTTPIREELVVALRNVRTRARYVPGTRHPLYAWWFTYMNTP